MKTVKRTPEIRVQSLIVTAWIPILIINTALFTHNYLSEIAIKAVLKGKSMVWILTLSFLLIVSLIFISKGKKTGLWLLISSLIPLVVTDFYMAFRSAYYALGFMAVFILILGSFQVVSLLKLLKRAYFNPKLKWYEGKPRAIPKIQARLFSNNEMLTAKLSNLDEQGCFVFGDHLIPLVDRIELSCNDHYVNKTVTPVVALERCSGYGVKFQIQNRDDEKEINEFVDYVRSQGYVD